MTFRVAVDLGTSSTCTAVSVDGAPPQLVLVDGSPLMSSAVCFDGRSVFVGAEAERQAALDPSRYEPHPKRRVDEGALLLGGAVLPVGQALAAVLRRAVGEARSVHRGRRVDQLVLTHPADWGSVRTGVLHGSAAGLADRVLLVPEPVAAAVLHGARTRPDARLAVLDLGAGTTDVTVLRRTPHGFRVLVTRGDPGFGGSDVDQALLDHLGQGVAAEHRADWESVVSAVGIDEGRRRRVLLTDVRGAKETLSRHSYADVPMPGSVPDAHLTRTGLEDLVAGRLGAVVELLVRSLREAGALTPEGRSTAEVVLVGGSSRIPLVSRLVHQRLGTVPVTNDQPETVVARGALLAVAPPAPPAPPRPVAPAPATRGPVPAGPPAVGPGARPPAPEPDTTILTPTPPTTPPARSRRGAVLVAAGAVAVVAAGVLAWVALGPDGGDGSGDGAAASVRVSAQRASFDVPVGWGEQSRSSDGDLARLVVAPDGSASAAVRIRLEQQELTPGTTLAAVGGTLEALLADAAADGDESFGPLETGVRYGDRDVLHYVQDEAAGTTVDWYVVVDRDVQLSIGCEGPGGAGGEVSAACEQAVRTVGVDGG